MRNTKIGDVFSVKLDDQNMKYFQLIAFDLTQLNSDVIRAFKQTYSVQASPGLSEIVDQEVDFYAHCVTKFGIKFNLWEKVGNISHIGEPNHIIFRDTNDYGYKIGQEPVKISHNWHVWHINDENFTRVGKLKGQNRKAEIGLVMNPMDIVHRMKNGVYEMMENYPGFE